MKNKEQVTDSLPLTPLEKGYKYLYTNGLPLTSIVSKDDYEAFFSKFGPVDFSFYEDHLVWVLQNPDPLHEEFMVEKGWDVRIMRHPRYLPYYNHNHRYFEIYYICKQPVSQIILGQEVHLNPGDILIMAPKTMHQCSIMNDVGECYIIAIRTSTFYTSFSTLMQQNEALSDFFLQELFKTSAIPYLILHAEDDGKIFKIIQLMLDEEKNKLPYAKELMNLYFQQFCILTMRYEQPELILEDEISKSPDGNIIIVKIIHYILKHFNNVTLPEVAHHFNYSETHVSRIIKACTGKTFAEIRTTARIQKAATMILGNPQVSIDDISHSVGYSEISTFYRAFHKIYGTTPVQYRNSHLKTLGGG